MPLCFHRAIIKLSLFLGVYAPSWWTLSLSSPILLLSLFSVFLFPSLPPSTLSFPFFLLSLFLFRVILPSLLTLCFSSSPSLSLSLCSVFFYLLYLPVLCFSSFSRFLSNLFYPFTLAFSLFVICKPVLLHERLCGT